MTKERFVKTQDGEYCNSETGEILTAEKVIEVLQKEKKRTSELVSSEILEIRKENNILTKKDTHYFNWNTSKGNPVFFSKSYKAFQREELKMMDIFEIGMMSILSANLESESNKVLLNGSSPTNKDLEVLSGLGTRKTKEVVSSLKKKSLIQTVGKGRAREIYVNPYWAFDGKDIEKATLDLFGIEY